MKNLETCDWMLLNSIIYKIYTTEDLDEMRREFLEQLRLVVDFDSADFYLAGHNEKDEMAQQNESPQNAHTLQSKRRCFSASPFS